MRGVFFLMVESCNLCGGFGAFCVSDSLMEICVFSCYNRVER